MAKGTNSAEIRTTDKRGAGKLQQIKDMRDFLKKQRIRIINLV
jgi:hypothetical protein